MKKKILIIDESESVCSEHTDLAKQVGLEVVGQVNNLNQALVQVNQVFPDIILMELLMQGQNGFEIISEIKKLKILSKIFICSFLEVQSVIYRTITLGVDSYLKKPLTKDALLNEVARVFQD